MTDWGRWICEQNIERFRTLLAAPHNEQEGRILAELLSREEAALARLLSEAGHMDGAQSNSSRAANRGSEPLPVRDGGADAQERDDSDPGRSQK